MNKEERKERLKELDEIFTDREGTEKEVKELRRLTLIQMRSELKQRENDTKQNLINKFEDILSELIKQGKLKYYPYKRDLKYFDKKYLKEGIKLYSGMLNKEAQK